MPKITKSEVHAYVHIMVELINKKEWKKEDIYTQQECLSIKPIAKCLGLKRPENIVKISEGVYYVIEAKNERNKLKLALKEAKVDYADKINQSDKIKAPIVTGIAGNSEEGFISTSQYFKNGKWLTITENNIEVTGLLSKNEIVTILNNNEPNISEIEISDNEFLKAAEEINGILHEGGINKDYRARVISALLLALVEGTKLNLDESPTVLISTINARVELVLNKHKKSNFARYIFIDLPSSEDNHIKFKKAIVLTIQELLGLNIRSAMNSGKDVLGKFYEVFLKYGNGAKEIGIVLTPRHITKFAAEAIDIQPNDLVLDPTCGTGGFLVSAFDEAKKKSTDSEFKKLKKHGLYGIEEQDPVVSLALVNMIFRGDGKNNIIEGNCFAKWLNVVRKNGSLQAEYLASDKPNRIPPITKVLMNPPFPKKKTDYKEYLFIDQALKQMQESGILFSVLPYSCMIKGGAYLTWRKNLLNQNTLLSAITFPEDLFYPVGVHTIGVFIKKGIAHSKNKKVVWFRALDDGRWKKKGKRLEHPKAQNDYPVILPILKRFINDQSVKIKSIPAFQIASTIDFSDPDLELVPEAYLEEPFVSTKDIEDDIDQLIRDNISFYIKFEKQIQRIENVKAN